MILQSDFYDIPDYSDLGSETVNTHLLAVIKAQDNTHEPFLKKILAATKLPENQYLIKSLDSERTHYQSLIANYSPSFVLFFGFNPQEIGVQMNITPYHSISIGNRQLLFAHNLSELNTNANYKKALWAQLKNWFHV